MGWRGIDELFEEMRQREGEADEELRQRYAEGGARIDEEREERVREGRYGRLPR